ncbi:MULTISPECIES: ribosomal protein S18-alanine N-acetyltransferase [Leuconostoc]|uniref:Ribosomal-protein-alanine N-acetyltransferase n=2 Tax=Leuconostoc kimchii TaxID=136609 RepID=D5T448_LEUKI|nr:MULTISPECIES: ribosomal protein S18-alanine N-acetyltransferase [Leuconostoc]ADG40986.1 ribosomal-protein-alanine N-acetyltransferase [Leuconostoc kimchii IMSNU 11154]AEJ31040.1 ribosomal-protein-alanine N-acetyltransferase [Leuconostoc sp. C2]QBR48134.1 ribosomal-protein-alanine N-acetyltransferase [Leuconostoc kimchii]
MFLKFNRHHKLPAALPKFEQKLVDTRGYSFILRRATVEDIDSLVHIEEAVYAGKAPWLLRDFLSELSRPRLRLYLVIQRNDQVIGFAGAAYNREKQDIHITNIAIVPIWQKNGLGTLMIEELAAFSRAVGVTTMSLEARASNHGAMALYQRLGFLKTDVKKGYYFGDHEDAITMVNHFEHKISDN